MSYRHNDLPVLNCKFDDRLTPRFFSNMAVPSAPLYSNEQERQDTLHSYQVTDTAKEKCFDNIVQLAIRIFNVPIAFISFIDGERTWFKASHGITVPEMPTATGLCGYTILNSEPFIITDALQHDIAKNNALVTGPMGLRFYAAVPLTVQNGHRIGTLCIADTKTREMPEADIESLGLLADMATEQLELRKQSQLQVVHQQDIMAHLSHELKNAISLVIGYAALLKDTEPGEEGFAQYCDVILKAGNRMSALAEEALVMAANRSPVFELKKSNIGLTALIKETTSRFSLLAKEKNQRLHVDIGVDVSIEGDAEKINEVIENLLSNAIKYSAHNKDIALSVQLAEQCTVRIIVKDEGPGFTDGDMMKLFQPFTRLSAKPTGGESSTGIGLYIAHKLVELHGGKIWAENSENGGAVFYVDLPCIESAL